MTQAISFRAARYRHVPFHIIRDAHGGDTEAMTLIWQHYEPYIRRLATLKVRGTSYLNVDLYDRLKTRLIFETMKFQL